LNTGRFLFWGMNRRDRTSALSKHGRTSRRFKAYRSPSRQNPDSDGKKGKVEEEGFCHLGVGWNGENRKCPYFLPIFLRGEKRC